MEPIDIKTFRHLLSVYGADLCRWPNVDVKNVLAFIDGDADAKAELEQASALDDALALYAVPEFDAERLMARIDDADIDGRADADIPAHIAAANHAGAGALRNVIWRGGMVFAVCSILMAGMVMMWQDAVPSAQQVPVDAGMAKMAMAKDIGNQIDELLVIAANGYQEQEQIQELMNVLDRDANASSVTQGGEVRENLDDAVNQWLEKEFNSLEGQEFLGDFITDNG